MRSQSPGPEPKDTSSQEPRAVVNPRIVPIDATADAMRVFASEHQAPAQSTKLMPIEGVEAIRVSVLPSEPKHAARDVSPSPAPRPGRWGWRNLTLAVLAVLAVGQGALIAFWMLSRGVAAAPPDTGSVTVTSEPAGSPVLIDGVERGATPLTVALSPGAYRIDVGTGTQIRTQGVNVTGGGDASVHVELRNAPPPGVVAGTGSLQITTEPAGARVWVDGEQRGVAPLTVSNLKVGDHAVTVRSAAGEPVNRTVTVQEGNVASLIIALNSSSAFASGWLAISSGVPLQITEKGALVGTTDSPRILMSTGLHELELVNPSLGYRVSRSVQIGPGQTTSVTLRPPMGTLSVNALPWAEVWIDGQRAGETPIGNFSIAIGNHELLFRHPELGEQRRSVTVGAIGPVRVGVDMRK